MLDTLEQHARHAAGRLPPSTHHWAVRGVREFSERLSVRQDVPEAPRRSQDDGAMVTVVDGGLGYAATSDVSQAGLRAVFERAVASGHYASRVERPAASATLPEKLGWLQEVCAAAGSCDARIVDRHARLWNVPTEQLYLTSDGARTEQQ
jgi:predicted Zn-dependent protease